MCTQNCRMLFDVCNYRNECLAVPLRSSHQTPMQRAAPHFTAKKAFIVFWPLAGVVSFLGRLLSPGDLAADASAPAGLFFLVDAGGGGCGASAAAGWLCCCSSSCLTSPALSSGFSGNAAVKIGILSLFLRSGRMRVDGKIETALNPRRLGVHSCDSILTDKSRAMQVKCPC